MPRARILLIGRRKGAISAAKRCGWKPVIIDVAARSEQTHEAFGGTAKRAVQKAAALFPDQPPVLVSAVATGSVVAAAAIRAHFNLPGISSTVAMRCHDKLVMKKAIAGAGIPCAPWIETSADTTPSELIDSLGLPVILKLPISSGGRGVWICESSDAIANHLQPGLLAEKFVTGSEMSIETFRANGRTLFRNHTQYLKPRWANIVPADLDADTASSIDSLCESVHTALGIDTGISHTEVFLSENGPVFGEIAARPPGGYLMDLMARAYDIDPWETLLRIAAGESPVISPQRKCFAGVWLIHPGAGTLKKAMGIENARAIPGIVEITTRFEPGQTFTPRIGSGESKGRIVAETATSQACAEALRKATAQIGFELT